MTANENSNLQVQTEPYYTKAQIMEMLNISENQVYDYVKKQKIRPLPNPYKMRKESVYYRQEVDLLAKERESLKSTYSVSEAAKKFGVSRQRIDYLIRAKKLKVEYVQLDKAKRIRLSESTLAQIKTILENEKNTSARHRKSTFYNEALNIALYQLFYDDEGNEYRVACQNKQWGFLLPDSTFVNYETLKFSIEPRAAYNIDLPNLNETNHTILMLPKTERTSWIIYDYFIATLGIHNVGIRDHREHIELQVAQGIIEFTKYPLPQDITESLFKKYVTAGEVILTDVELFLVGKSHHLRTTISLENYKALTAEADSKKISTADLLEQILTERYQK